MLQVRVNFSQRIIFCDTRRIPA